MTMPTAGAHITLPNAGVAGPVHNNSMKFLMLLGLVSAVTGLVSAALGRDKKREIENDGVSAVSIPIHWV
jgi:hypothetical protein